MRKLAEVVGVPEGPKSRVVVDLPRAASWRRMHYLGHSRVPLCLGALPTKLHRVPLDPV